jgi:hypothetical protein
LLWSWDFPASRIVKNQFLFFTNYPMWSVRSVFYNSTKWTKIPLDFFTWLNKQKTSILEAGTFHPPSHPYGHFLLLSVITGLFCSFLLAAIMVWMLFCPSPPQFLCWAQITIVVVLGSGFHKMIKPL